MSEATISLDPFYGMVDFFFPDGQWRFRIQRDDGWFYTPSGSDALTIRLYDAATRQWLCSGSCCAGADHLLPYEEAVPGLVSHFRYRQGAYEVAFAAATVQHHTGHSLSQLSCLLWTEGDNTLPCYYPRRYLAAAEGVALPSGQWQVTIPCWSVVGEARFPDLTTSDLITRVRSSVPYQIEWTIEDGNSFARFRLPALMVVWAPDQSGQRWEGALLLDRICYQGELLIPQQTVPEITPPDYLPQHADERVIMSYQQVSVYVAMGGCPERWSASSIDCSSNFADPFTIPFVEAWRTPFTRQQRYQEPPSLEQEKIYHRRYRYFWQQDYFFYETGLGSDRLRNLRAQRIQSPYSGFEQWQVLPLAEESN
ncbi:MAG: hypothetical protein HQM06_00190 [Magnetococcales bacterium]|nr:hypothetical protein [Magnetococcales bacterium]